MKLNSLVGLLLLPFSILVSLAIVVVAVQLIDIGALGWLALGFMVCGLLHVILWSTRRLRWPARGLWSLYHLHVGEHELAHAIFGRLLLAGVAEVKVDPKRQSYVLLSPPHGFRWAVVLAPFYFPLLTVPLVVLHVLVADIAHQGVLSTLEFVVGFSLAFHFAGLCYEFRPTTFDVGLVGLLPALSIVLALNTVYVVAITGLVTQDQAFMVQLLAAMWKAALECWEGACAIVRLCVC